VNINVDQFVISDQSEILDLLNKCNQLGIDNYEMIGGTGGRSIYSFKGSVADSPRGYYYNLNLFFSRPGLPSKTFIKKSFSLSQRYSASKELPSIDITSIVDDYARTANKLGLAKINLKSIFV
jgi:hypothetical protein